MDKKVCIITGANSGIGKQAAIQIAQAGCHVILACRNPARGEAALEEIRSTAKKASVELMIVDLSLQYSIREFEKRFRAAHETLDIIIHNAADFDVRRKQALFTEEGIERIWATNYVGPVLMTSLLLDIIKKSEQGRILTVSSKGLMAFPFLVVDLNDTEFRHRRFSVRKAYYHSKLALEMYTSGLSEELEQTPVTVNCIRVTNVLIDVDRRYPHVSKFKRSLYSIKQKFSISPQQMAETYRYAALSQDVGTITGMYFEYPNRVGNKLKYNHSKTEQLQVLTGKFIETN